MPTQSQIVEIDFEQAIEETSRFTNIFEFDNGTMKIISGDHPDLGSVFLIVPPMGKAVVLPSSETIVSQLFRS